MVDKESIEQVAKNARIRLSDGEKEVFRKDFDSILESFESLDKIDTEGVDPAFHPVELDEESREDKVEKGFSKDEVFANTNNVEKDCFKGPRAK